MNNSLAEVHPELVSEWSEKNLTLTPDDITFGSNKKVWWRGACGHEWQASVKARSNGEKCPICSGARVIAGIKDLATLEPLLAKQWSKKNGGEWSDPRGVYADVPPRVEYSLTEPGRSLKPIPDPMMVWGEGCKRQFGES